MTSLMHDIHDTVRQKRQHIVLPEGNDPRILQATAQILKEGIADITLIGDKKSILQQAQKMHLDLKKASFVNHQTSKKREEYRALLASIQQRKKLSKEEITTFMKNPIFFAALMVKNGDADGYVSGATHETTETLRPALKVFKTKDKCVASSFFLMDTPRGNFIFADCGFIIDPSSEELKDITLASVASAKRIGITPRVAMLSFSTKSETIKTATTEKITTALQLIQQASPDLLIDGPVQLDAAIIPEVAQLKNPDSPLQGNATILIFPNLDAGNIGYKLVERFGQARAIGPLLQGFNYPVHDLSRGCSVSDIIDIVALTALDAITLKEKKSQTKI